MTILILNIHKNAHAYLDSFMWCMAVYLGNFAKVVKGYRPPNRCTLGMSFSRRLNETNVEPMNPVMRHQKRSAPAMISANGV